MKSLQEDFYVCVVTFFADIVKQNSTYLHKIYMYKKCKKDNMIVF